MIYFPENPTLGQRYVGVNGVTYTWMGDRWNGVNALETGRAEYYVDNSDAEFEYDAVRDGLLDGGNAQGTASLEINLTSVSSSQWGYVTAVYELAGVSQGVYDEQGVIISNSTLGYLDHPEYCDGGYGNGYRSSLRVNNTGQYIDCNDAVQTTIQDGVFTQSLPAWVFSDQDVQVVAYIKSGQTVIYSEPVSVHVDYIPCFVAGTAITLADGSKKAIEDITYADELRVWDFDAGCQSSARPLWIKRPQTIPEYNHARFADGTELRTLQVVRGHRVFCADTNQFEFVGLLPIGSTVVKDGTTTRLTSVEHAQGMVTYYNIITDYHMNLYANDVLTSTGFNNLYPVKDMKFEKQSRQPRTFTGIAEYWISGLRLAENTTEDVAAMTRHLNMLDSLKLGK